MLNTSQEIAAGDLLWQRFAASDPHLFLGSDAEFHFPSLCASMIAASRELEQSPAAAPDPQTLARRAWEIYSGETDE